ncbi:PREDICTED: nucleoporin p58/p45 isoform X2 [Nicrophorus vespilloides]|uniref:Nucleoporin p58/p45 isoform X2 n=1 Tax=Nicrophorus vespilloides TaxID=110193 RepID=A0ABM1MD66_NICVS|nr:PREDICTED: nucleoporin p58/p45 isoform X2 [Nicrophorus vespilloides]
MSFSFGSKPAATGFGVTPQTNTFGVSQPAQQPATGFGAPNAGLFNTAGTNTGLTFGATPTMNAPAAAAPANTGLSFGSTPNTGLFGAPPASKPALGFGATPAAASTGLSFGAPANTGLSFGAATTTAANTSLNFGGTAATSAPTLGLSFGSSAATTTPLNFGAAATSAPSGGLSFGLGANTLSFGNTPTAAPASSAAPVGLGGIASSTPSTGTATKTTEQAPKEQHLPNEIQQTVENFKNFVKQQKIYSSDVARYSIKEFRRVESDIDQVNNLLNEVEKQLQMNKNVAEKLKYDTAKGLQHVEMAQRTYDTPMGLQYENTAPYLFFVELVDNFERELQNMKLQIENTDKYVKNIGKSSPLSSQDLALGMRRIHEAFVALAGRLQSVHSQVESQKEQYLNFRKHMLNDSTNVFDKKTKETDALNIALNTIHFQPPQMGTGPTPFNSVSHPSVIQAAVQNQAPTFQPTNSFGGFNTTEKPMFGNTNTFGQSFNSSAPTNTFQLQKPPTGSKRGKQ